MSERDSHPTFPARYRLLRRREYEAVSQGGRKHQNRFFLLLLRVTSQDNPRPGVPRLGVTVSKRVSKKAVTRNRVKRVLRESFRLRRALLPSHDYVVIARPPCAAAARRELRVAIDVMWDAMCKEPS